MCAKLVKFIARSTSPSYSPDALLAHLMHLMGSSTAPSSTGAAVLLLKALSPSRAATARTAFHLLALQIGMGQPLLPYTRALAAVLVRCKARAPAAVAAALLHAASDDDDDDAETKERPQWHQYAVQCAALLAIQLLADGGQRNDKKGDDSRASRRMIPVAMRIADALDAMIALQRDKQRQTPHQLSKKRNTSARPTTQPRGRRRAQQRPEEQEKEQEREEDDDHTAAAQPQPEQTGDTNEDVGGDACDTEITACMLRATLGTALWRSGDIDAGDALHQAAEAATALVSSFSFSSASSSTAPRASHRRRALQLQLGVALDDAAGACLLVGAAAAEGALLHALLQLPGGSDGAEGALADALGRLAHYRGPLRHRMAALHQPLALSEPQQVATRTAALLDDCRAAEAAETSSSVADTDNVRTAAVAARVSMCYSGACLSSALQRLQKALRQARAIAALQPHDARVLANALEAFECVGRLHRARGQPLHAKKMWTMGRERAERWHSAEYVRLFDALLSTLAMDRGEHCAFIGQEAQRRCVDSTKKQWTAATAELAAAAARAVPYGAKGEVVALQQLSVALEQSAQEALHAMAEHTVVDVMGGDAGERGLLLPGLRALMAEKAAAEGDLAAAARLLRPFASGSLAPLYRRSVTEWAEAELCANQRRVTRLWAVGALVATHHDDNIQNDEGEGDDDEEWQSLEMLEEVWDQCRSLRPADVTARVARLRAEMMGESRSKEAGELLFEACGTSLW